MFAITKYLQLRMAHRSQSVLDTVLPHALRNHECVRHSIRQLCSHVELGYRPSRQRYTGNSMRDCDTLIGGDRMLSQRTRATSGDRPVQYNPIRTYVHASAANSVPANNHKTTDTSTHDSTQAHGGASTTDAGKAKHTHSMASGLNGVHTEHPNEVQSMSWFSQRKDSVLQVLRQVRKLGTESYMVMKLYWYGGAHTRGQYEMIERNSKDLAQLIPFTVMAALPGAFFALPVLLKVFPGFMPSVFQGKSFKAEQVMIMTQARKKSRDQCHALFTALMAEVRAMDAATADTLQHITDGVFLEDRPAPSEEELCGHLLQMHRFFVQNVSWSTFSHRQRRLIASHFGTPSLLTPGQKTTANLNRIVWDDVAMIKENVDTLTYEELVESSSRRGLGVVNLTHADLKKQMKSWHLLSTKTHCDSPPLLSIASMSLFHRDARRVSHMDGDSSQQEALSNP